MDHTNAIETHAVERYLLGELSEADVEAFEEHYFDCAACAEDVRDEMRFMEGGREAARETIAPLAPVVSIGERRHRRIGWMQLTAAAVLAVGIAVPQFMQQEDSWAGRPHRFSASRSATDMSFAADKPIHASVDIQSEPGYVRFDMEIVDAKRRNVRVLPSVSAETATETVFFVTPELPEGAYVLSIIGVRGDGNRTVTETHEFNVVP